MSKRNHLPFIVECKPGGQAFYEPIAAFNVDRVAIRYATECFQNASGMGYHYRVRDARKRRPTSVLLYSSEHPVSRFTYRDITKAHLVINVFLDDRNVGRIKQSGELYFYVPKGQPDRKGGQLFHSVEAVKRSLEAQ